LIGVPRQRLDLLPQYARIAASLSTVATSPATSISAQLATQLRAEFRNLCRRKATAALRKDLMEIRLKNARYIAELTKFGSRFGAPPALALSSLKLCLEDFTGGNVNVACAILEGCGRYLIASKHTAVGNPHQLHLHLHSILCEARSLFKCTIFSFKNMDHRQKPSAFCRS
jgi:regulator of nonsense transcripts 2